MKTLLAALLLAASSCFAQTTEVVDLPTRAGVTERMVAIAPAAVPKAVVILLTGGQGRVRIFDNGSIRNEGNFLLRSRMLFVQQGFAAVAVDAPSDHSGGMQVNFRESADHVADLAAAIAWARDKWHKPVWVIGTSRGTQSAAYLAVALAGDARGPDGVVLTSSILESTRRDPGAPVQDLALDKIKVPVLVVHHENDPCGACSPARVREVMAKLPSATSKLSMASGGVSTGEPCEPFSHHGYNGIEGTVVASISAFITGH